LRWNVKHCRMRSDNVPTPSHNENDHRRRELISPRAIAPTELSVHRLVQATRRTRAQSDWTVLVLVLVLRSDHCNVPLCLGSEYRTVAMLLSTTSHRVRVPNAYAS
jgi:hypothetical protein